MKLKVKKLSDTAKLPVKNNKFDAGFDVFADEHVALNYDDVIKVELGVAVEIPDGYVGFLTGRSGLTAKTPLRVQLGIIDSTFRGPIKATCELKELMKNNDADSDGKTEFVIFKGDKIAQLVICPIADMHEVEEVDELSKTERGDKGFGSSGY